MELTDLVKGCKKYPTPSVSAIGVAVAVDAKGLPRFLLGSSYVLPSDYPVFPLLTTRLEKRGITMRICPHSNLARLVLVLAAVFLVSSRSVGEEPARAAALAEVRVGIDDGDFRGSDHRALQAAVDYVARLGGGTVRIDPGRYQMRNALTRRDNVQIIGVPARRSWRPATASTAS
jgi:hypothetical protein